jgi:cysteinyl-tRNA synthetase
VRALLSEAQAEAIRREVSVAAREASANSEQRLMALDRQLEQDRHQTRLLEVQLLAEREVARVERDFARADRARDRLVELGFEVRDLPDGPELRRL